MEINQNKRVFTITQKIPFYDSDYLGRIKLSAVLKMFAQIAGDDYIDRGMSYDFLREHNRAFLVSRIALKFNKYPTHEDIVSVNTWEHGKKGAMYLRGYEMVSENGEVAIEGEAGWICVNLDTRKIERPSAFPWPVEQMEEKGTAVSIGKIECKGAELASEYKLSNNDIDANGHLYNGTYGDIITNSLPKEEFEQDYSEFRLNYVNEAVYGDTISIYKEYTECGIILIGKVDEKVCFEAEFKRTGINML